MPPRDAPPLYPFAITKHSFLSESYLCIIKTPRTAANGQGRHKRYTTLIRLRIAPPPSSAPPARSVPCNGRTRPALRQIGFRQVTPGPVQQGTPIGSHRPPTLFGRDTPCLFPITVFYKIRIILNSFGGFVKYFVLTNRFITVGVTMMCDKQKKG